MVDKIHSNSVNHVVSNALAKANQAEKADGVGNQAPKVGGCEHTNDGSTTTSISQRARLLAQAIQFSRQVPEQASVIADTRVADLKALYETGGADAILNQYTDEALAESVLKSPLKAFLR